MSKPDRTVTIGKVAVDSGHLMLVDPCYVLADKPKEQNDKYWKVFLDGATESDRKENTGIAVVDGLGVAFSSGLGDGMYTVTAIIGDVPGWGTRVKSVTVHFMEDPDEDEDQPEFDGTDQVSERDVYPRDNMGSNYDRYNH